MAVSEAEEEDTNWKDRLEDSHLSLCAFPTSLALEHMFSDHNVGGGWDLHFQLFLYNLLSGVGIILCPWINEACPLQRFT